jgi:hypothetical protein
MVADHDGPTMFARIGFMRALNRRVERVVNPDRKEHHWERRKLARERWSQKNGPCLGAIFSSLLVVPVTVTFNDYCSVTILIVPAAMVPTVMSIELGARAAIVITVVISIASESEAETLGARYCGRCNRDGR